MTTYKLSRWGSLFLIALVATFAVFIGGCKATTSAGFPPQSYQIKAQQEALSNQIKDEAAYITRYTGETDSVEQKKIRDAYIGIRLRLADIAYNEFTKQFIFEKQVADGSVDIGVIGISTAAALIDPSSTTQLLAALSGALTGSKAVTDRVFYYEQTARSLYAAMNANRLAVSAEIRSSMRLGTEDYQLYDAMSDLDRYYGAGTFIGALDSIQASAVDKGKKATQVLQDLRTGSYTVDEAKKKLRAYIYDEQNVGIPANVQALKDWIEENASGLSIGPLLNNSATAELRIKAVTDLGLLD